MMKANPYIASVMVPHNVIHFVKERSNRSVLLLGGGFMRFFLLGESVYLWSVEASAEVSVSSPVSEVTEVLAGSEDAEGSDGLS